MNIFPEIKLHQDIKQAANRLKTKLIALPISQIEISDYNKRYLQTKISNIDYILDIYIRILYLALEKNHSGNYQITLVDYGGGSGVFSLLAKELGVKTVIYNDIYDVSCNDIAIISRNLNLKIDYIVCGDIDQIKVFLNEKGISINALTSFDVIEHIYDIEKHIHTLADPVFHNIRVVYGSGANQMNPRQAYILKKMHKKVELHDSNPEWGHKQRDSLKAFIKIRKEIIENYNPGLSTQEIEMLAKKTRGLYKPDIEKTVDQYIETGKITYIPNHPTNTCDPYTGNWSEHLMSVSWLKQKFNASGYRIKIIPGLFPVIGGSSVPSKIKRILNYFIYFLRVKGLIFSPYFVIKADNNR
jgi:hypothetical protein